MFRGNTKISYSLSTRLFSRPDMVYAYIRGLLKCGHHNTKGGSKMAKKKTGVKAGKSASKVLRSKKTGKDSKTAAGSALSQREPKRRKK